MPELLAIVGLAIGTLAYFLLVRRRASVRSGIASMTRALAASNEMALQRLHLKPAAGAAKPAPKGRSDIGIERRSGEDRRKTSHRRFGRGRRTGEERRRG